MDEENEIDLSPYTPSKKNNVKTSELFNDTHYAKSNKTSRSTHRASETCKKIAKILAVIALIITAITVGIVILASTIKLEMNNINDSYIKLFINTKEIITKQMYFEQKENVEEYRLLDKNIIAEELNIEQSLILKAYKVYNSDGEVEVKDIKGIKALMRYNSIEDILTPVNFRTTTKGVIATLQGDNTIIAFNINKKELFKRLNYEQNNINIIAYKFLDYIGIDIQKCIDYTEIDFNTKFDIHKDTLPFGTVWDKNNGVCSIGQAWLTGLIYNYKINKFNYETISEIYAEIEPNGNKQYNYDITEYISNRPNEISFKSNLIGRYEQIETDKLPRPDREFTGAINHLSYIANLKIVKDLYEVDEGKQIIEAIQSQLENNKTILCVMGNNNVTHSVLVYGLNKCKIDPDLIYLSCYDYNHEGQIKVIEARCRIYRDLQGDNKLYLEFKYENGEGASWSSNESVFMFYSIQENFTLERLK